MQLCILYNFWNTHKHFQLGKMSKNANFEVNLCYERKELRIATASAINSTISHFQLSHYLLWGNWDLERKSAGFCYTRQLIGNLIDLFSLSPLCTLNLMLSSFLYVVACFISDDGSYYCGMKDITLRTVLSPERKPTCS